MEVIISVLELLKGQVINETIGKVSANLGIGKDEASVAVSSALPLLIKALAKNSQDDKGAKSLFNAIEKDHDGSILDDVAGFFAKKDTGMGAGILKHVLGGQRSIVETGLSKISGLDKSNSKTVLAMLAPIVLGAISKKKQADGLDVGGLVNMLRGEEDEVKSKDPEATGLFEKLLDSDGDGQIADDAVDIGAKLLKSFLG